MLNTNIPNEATYLDWSTFQVVVADATPEIIAALDQAAVYERQAAEARELAKTVGDKATMATVAATLDRLAAQQRAKAEWLWTRRRETRDGATVWATPPAEAPVDPRDERARQLAASGAVRRLSTTWFEVTGASGYVYLVIQEGGRVSCTCPDHQQRGALCKHARAALIHTNATEPTERAA